MPVRDSSEHGSLLSSSPTTFETYGGNYVDLLNPDPATIELEDIAHACAMICRYNGSVDRHYSVAEHMVFVHDLLEWQNAPRPIRKACMFHDASEAFLGDVTNPLKYALREAGAIGGTGRSVYDVLCERMDRAISYRFEFVQRHIKDRTLVNTDVWASRLEASQMLKSKGEGWRGRNLFEFPNDGQLPPEVGDLWACGLPAEEAERLYLKRVRFYL